MITRDDLNRYTLNTVYFTLRSYKDGDISYETIPNDKESISLLKVKDNMVVDKLILHTNENFETIELKILRFINRTIDDLNSFYE